MNDQLIGEVLAEVTRSGIVESIHTGHFVALNADGSVLLQKGEPSAIIFPRSSIKAIQASAMVRHGLRLEPRLLALVCASHSGLKMHQDGVLEILSRAGLDERVLQNAKGKPLDENERSKISEPTRLAMNCSGKHAGMILTSHLNGWPIESYLDQFHPLQVACKKELENLANEKVSLIGKDGCGAPLFAISLIGLARAISNLTKSSDWIHQGVIKSCKEFPEMVAGVGRLTTQMMQSVSGLFMKEGAEGVEVASLPDGRTFAFKVSDGSTRSFPTLVTASLKLFGVDTPIEGEKIYGGEEVVGTIRAILK